MPRSVAIASPHTGQEILSLLSRLNRDGQTVVMVTHDASVAAAAHRTVTLVDGQVRAKPVAGAKS